jgi:hypothetical protein
MGYPFMVEAINATESSCPPREKIPAASADCSRYSGSSRSCLDGANDAKIPRQLGAPEFAARFREYAIGEQAHEFWLRKGCTIGHNGLIDDRDLDGLAGFNDGGFLEVKP